MIEYIELIELPDVPGQESWLLSSLLADAGEEGGADELEGEVEHG